MIRPLIAGMVVAASALSLAGPSAQARDSQFNNCIGLCTKQEYNCRFAGTYTPKCQAKFRVCADSCARTGRPISFGLIR